MTRIYEVHLTKQATKDLKKVPKHVALKLRAWIDDVWHRGWQSVKSVPGYHDEALKGKRKGQRSIRLSRSYRAIYEIDEAGDIHFIRVLEVNKHEY